MDDIVDSFIIEDELPEPRRRRPATASGSGDDGGSKVVSAGLPDPDFFSCCSILIPCNLPVHASLWLGQYANLLARVEGPLALVRLSGNSCETEVFGDDITLPTLADTEGDSLFALMSWLSSTVKRVLIVPSPIDRDVDLLATGLPLQLVSGTDSTALVGAYQRAKGLCMAAPSLHQLSPTIGLVMVGAQAPIGQKASAKIVDCASRFLQAEITLDANVDRMDVLGPRHSISINRDSAYGIGDLIAAIHRSASMPEEATIEAPTYLEDEVLQVIDREEYAQLESVFDRAGAEADAEREVEGSIDEPANDTLEPTTPVTEHVPEDEYTLDERLRPRDEFGVPSDLLAFLPDLRPIPIHDFENMIVPGVAYGVDAQQRLHLVCLGGDVTKLSVAEHLISSRANRSMLNAALDQKGLGRLAPFSDNGLQRHALLPEADASKAGLLHRGKYNVHLLIESESGMRRVNLD